MKSEDGVLKSNDGKLGAGSMLLFRPRAWPQAHNGFQARWGGIKRIRGQSRDLPLCLLGSSDVRFEARAHLLPDPASGKRKGDLLSFSPILHTAS